MNGVFHDHLDHSVVIYVSDIPIYLYDPAEHRGFVNILLQYLCQHRLYVKLGNVDVRGERHRILDS